MANEPNHDNSELRAISALKALEEERLAREAELDAAEPELFDKPPVRTARGTAPLAALTEAPQAVLEDKIGQLAQEAEEAVERYTAAEEALQRFAGDDDSTEEYAIAEANKQRLMQAAEAAIEEYETAQAELQIVIEEAAAAASRPIPLSRDVWPTVSMPVATVADIQVPIAPGAETSRRGPMGKIFGALLAVGVIAVVAVMIQAASPSGSSDSAVTPDINEPTGPATPSPAAAPALTPAQKARKKWEASEAARQAEKDARRKKRIRKRPKPLDPNSKVRVNCNPNDPLCGV